MRTTIHHLTRVPWQSVAVMAALASLVAVPQIAGAAVWFAAQQVLTVLPAMSIGIVLTAGVSASGSMALVASAFHGRTIRMLLLASLIGALTPVCGITVLPLIVGLLASRVPLAPIMAFWLSSPITSPGMLAVTAATLGTPFAIGKTTGAFLIGVYGGLAVLALTRFGLLQAPARQNAALRVAATDCCSAQPPDGVDWHIWRSPERRRIFIDVAISTGRLMLIWLSIAFVCEHFLMHYLPQDFIIALVGQGQAWAVPIAATLGAPLYLDGFAALPLVRGLIEAGMRPDAAMALLVAGGITSAWAIVPVLALVRLPVVFCYVLLAVSASMLAGWGYGMIQ